MRNDIKIAVVAVSEESLPLAGYVAGELGADRYSLSHTEGWIPTESLASLTASCFHNYEAWVMFCSVGICLRTVAPHIQDKHTDPAVVVVDSTGKWTIPVLSGHVGGANELAVRIAGLTSGEAVLTTRSDNSGLWPLDTLAARFGWKEKIEGASMNEVIFRFVNRRPTALLIGCRDKGTHYLETTVPEHVNICYREADIPQDTELIISVSPFTVRYGSVPVLSYIPPVLRLGAGCRKGCSPEGVSGYIRTFLKGNGLHPEAVGRISTIGLKKDEPLIKALSLDLEAETDIWSADELKDVAVPNPSEKVQEVTGTASVAEAAAARSAGDNAVFLISKQKACLNEHNDFTFAVAASPLYIRRGHIEIVGAGPGDPDLISVRGRHFLEQADLILYAGSLIPERVTYCAKAGAVIRSSAPMTLEEQFSLMKDFYNRGCLIVRLHTGDPCIYGAIQEQMNFMDRYGMSYHITPGISSFQAAAAELRSQFTIPGEVQTIILTRGEGRTPMPEREKLHLLARSRSTMCIFLSAGIAERVQEELLEHYPPQTPVAVCHHLTWPDQRIWKGELNRLAEIVNSNNLTLTTMIVVGEAIGNRHGLSCLYNKGFSHIFRP